MSAVEAGSVAEAPKRRSIRPRDADQCVTLYGIGWAGYRRMLRMRGERSRPRMIYLDGDLVLMSPGRLHETDKTRFGQFIDALTEELDMPCEPVGSMTYRRHKKEAGLEPDQSYYLANASRIQRKETIDLRVDSPPDLTIEVVYSNSAKAAVEVSRRFRIPEVWVSTEHGLRFLVLGEDGEYAESQISPAFPFLTASEILDWVRRPPPEGGTNTDWRKDLRRWVRNVVGPRVADRGD